MKLSYEYIRGLTAGEGTFTFSMNTVRGVKRRTPAFAIRMAVRDKELIEGVRDSLNLKNKVYIYNHQGKDGSIRQPQAMLIVREFPALRDVIIPVFYKRLKGYKRIQFEEWINNIGNDPLVPKTFKILYKIYQNGYFEEKAKRFE